MFLDYEVCRCFWIMKSAVPEWCWNNLKLFFALQKKSGNHLKNAKDGLTAFSAEWYSLFFHEKDVKIILGLIGVDRQVAFSWDFRVYWVLLTYFCCKLFLIFTYLMIWLWKSFLFLRQQRVKFCNGKFCSEFKQNCMPVRQIAAVYRIGKDADGE